MSSGVLKRLSEQQVPPPPAALDREVNTRLNDQLLLAHVVDFVFRAMPYTFLEFGRALLALAFTTLTGQTPGPRRRRP